MLSFVSRHWSLSHAKTPLPLPPPSQPLLYMQVGVLVTGRSNTSLLCSLPKSQVSMVTETQFRARIHQRQCSPTGQTNEMKCNIDVVAVCSVMSAPLQSSRTSI